MLGAYFRALKAAFLASTLLPIVTAVCSRFNAEGRSGSAGFWVKLVLAGSAVFLANAAFGILLRRFRSQIDLHSAEQVVFLERLLSAGWTGRLCLQLRSASSWNWP